MFNRNYARNVSERGIKGGLLIKINNQRIIVHEHSESKPTENLPNCSYWKHFSFQPSIIKMSVIAKVGEFSLVNPEVDYAARYTTMGFSTCFFDSICCSVIEKDKS